MSEVSSLGFFKMGIILAVLKAVSTWSDVMESFVMMMKVRQFCELVWRHLWAGGGIAGVDNMHNYLGGISNQQAGRRMKKKVES